MTRKFVETRYPRPTSFEGQETLLPNLRRFWLRLKNTKLFQAIKHSYLNPYHWGIPNIKAHSLEKAYEKARKTYKSRFIYKGVRYNSEYRIDVNQEMLETGHVIRGRKSKDVSAMIPRNEKGELDLMAEEPILISIIPLDGISVTGHVSLQYKDRVVNRILREINMEPLYPRYQEQSEYFFVYPSQIGVDPKKLIREIDKHNIICGDKKYNIGTNNCAKNVAQLLKKVGVKDINFLGVDKLGVVFPTPGNNPFNFGIKAWCFKHGVPVHLEEVALLYRYHEIPNVEARKEEFKQIRERYRSLTKTMNDSVLKKISFIHLKKVFLSKIHKR